MSIEEQHIWKLYCSISAYMEEALNIKSTEFNTMLLKAYIFENAEILYQYLEPDIIEKLNELVFEDLDSLLQMNSGLSEKFIDKIVSRGEGDKYHSSAEVSVPKSARLGNWNALRDDSMLNETEFVKNTVPETLIPEELPTKSEAGISSFIYKMEHQSADEGQEQTVEERIAEIRDALEKHSIVIVQGSTGCGKTTKIPLLLLENYQNIVCTQPRRLAAIGAAKRVASVMNCKLGTVVGYAVRFDDVTSKNTRLRFVTDGILLKEMASLGKSGVDYKRGLKYDLVIIDEAHERSLNIDFLMGYFKGNKQTKLLIMSATLDSEKFVDYFNCPLIKINHRQHSLEYFYAKHPVKNYLKSAQSVAMKLVSETEEGNILVFLTGQEEIEASCKAIGPVLAGAGVDVLRLYSTMPPDEQEKVFVEGSRKVVFCTNIAETSLTIRGVKYVIDCGRFKQMRRREDTSVDLLETIFISKAQAGQRAGRAGRTAPGIVYRLYTYDEYQRMENSPMPEILRVNLSGAVLALKALGINDVVNFDFIDHPALESIKSSLCFLYYLGAVDGLGNVTALGRRLSVMAPEPEMAMTLLTAERIGCLDEVSTIAAFLTVSNIFIESAGEREQLNSIKRRFQHPKGEFYMFLQIFEDWKKENFKTSFLAKNCLKPKAMFEVLRIKLQLMDRPSSKSVPKLKTLVTEASITRPEKEYIGKIEIAFCAGYFMNVARRLGTQYSTIFGGTECYLHPSDSLFKMNPKFVLFYEIVCVKKEYMRYCLEVDASVLTNACNFNRK